VKKQSVRILHREEEIKHIVCSLRMTLNINEDDPEYVKVLSYKGSDALIKRSTIDGIFGHRVFIPNVDGILCNHNGKIINPTRLWMKWDAIPAWITESKGLEHNYLNSNDPAVTIPDNEICRFYNEQYLIFRQSSCIHWKMREKYIEQFNAATLKIFLDSYGNIKQFGKNNDQLPGIDDFVQYIKDVGSSLGVNKVIVPEFMTVLVMIDKVKESLNKLIADNKYSASNIHPSLNWLLNDNKVKESKPTKRAKGTVSEKGS